MSGGKSWARDEELLAALLSILRLHGDAALPASLAGDELRRLHPELWKRWKARSTGGSLLQTCAAANEFGIFVEEKAVGADGSASQRGEPLIRCETRDAPCTEGGAGSCADPQISEDLKQAVIRRMGRHSSAEAESADSVPIAWLVIACEKALLRHIRLLPRYEREAKDLPPELDLTDTTTVTSQTSKALRKKRMALRLVAFLHHHRPLFAYSSQSGDPLDGFAAYHPQGRRAWRRPKPKPRSAEELQLLAAGHECWVVLLRNQGSRSKEAQVMAMEFHCAAAAAGVSSDQLQEVAPGLFLLHGFDQTASFASAALRRAPLRLLGAFGSAEALVQRVPEVLRGYSSWWLSLELRDAPLDAAALPLRSSPSAQVALAAAAAAEAAPAKLRRSEGSRHLELLVLEAEGTLLLTQAILPELEESWQTAWVRRRFHFSAGLDVYVASAVVSLAQMEAKRLELPEGPFLDACCGSGTLSAAAANAKCFTQVIACDVDPQFLSRAAENFEMLDAPPKVELHDARRPFAPLGSHVPRVVAANPPWGWRIGHGEDLAREIATNLMREFPASVLAFVCPELPDPSCHQLTWSCALGQSAVWILVDGLVRARIGPGLVLMMGFREGDQYDDLKAVAQKVAKLQLWTDVAGEEIGDSQPKLVDVMDSGFEVLVVLQQSLCTSFPSLTPCQKNAMAQEDAQRLVQDFVRHLRAAYQKEMVLDAPAGQVRIDTTAEGTGMFDLSCLAPTDAGARSPKEIPAAAVSKPPPLKADVASVTRALRQIQGMSRSKQALASIQLTKIMGLAKFRESLSEVDQAGADSFAEALEQVAPFFTERQQEQISEWTGLFMSAEPLPPVKAKTETKEEEDEEAEVPQANEDEDDLERQMANLREEVADPAAAARKAKRVAAAKAAHAAALRLRQRHMRQALSFAPWAQNPSQWQQWQQPAEPSRPPAWKAQTQPALAEFVATRPRERAARRFGEAGVMAHDPFDCSLMSLELEELRSSMENLQTWAFSTVWSPKSKSGAGFVAAVSVSIQRPRVCRYAKLRDLLVLCEVPSPSTQAVRAVLEPIHALDIRSMFAELEEAKRADILLEILQVLAEDGRLDVRDFTRAISTCSKLRAWQHACAVLRTMASGQVQPNEISFNATISACQRAQQWQQAIAVFQSMPESSVAANQVSFNAVISACREGACWQEAVALFNLMPATKLKADTISFSTTISACEKAKQWQLALALFGDMPRASVHANGIVFNSTISACEKGGKWQQALALLMSMYAAQLQADDISFNATISACEKGGQWQQASALLTAMAAAQVQADGISFNASISACEKGGQWQQALVLLQAMPVAKVKADEISFNATISACEKGGQWQQALALFMSMAFAKVQSDHISFNATISACEKGGQWQQALALLLSMPGASVRTDDISFNATISACQKGWQWQHALALFSSMPEESAQRDEISFSAAISACEKSGQWEQSLALFRAIPEAMLRANQVSFNATISAYEKTMQWQQAFGLFWSMPESQVPASEVSFGASISACEKAAVWRQAVALLWSMPASKVQANEVSFNAAISACEKGVVGQ
ncbi:unnamed protein product [Effrenium voratum]|nr:unnamed protein product [Effrenium voratum]